MFAIYNLKTPELLAQHLADLTLCLRASAHTSVFSSKSEAEQREMLESLIVGNGVILKAFDQRSGRTQGLLAAEVRNGNEFGVLELWIDPAAEARLPQLIFDQLKREVAKREYKAVYCNSDWYLSVQNTAIQDLFTM
ncbi:MAG: hypothetical protein KDK39_09280 [Leptospiraceae bacterium]|nr:hypothetical protein [Leptospiraceae bacterium]